MADPDPVTPNLLLLGGEILHSHRQSTMSVIYSANEDGEHAKYLLIGFGHSS